MGLLVLVIAVIIAGLAPIGISVAMIFRNKLSSWLSKKPWVRFSIMIIAGASLIFALAIMPDYMVDAWEIVVVVISSLLAVLILLGNAVPKGRPSSRFWEAMSQLNATSFVGALAAVLAFMTLGIAINPLCGS